jgi:Zn-dependent M16 (insulinase) family peptidase
LKIPDLTFAGFQSFHREFYHPSNSRVFFYGDDPVANAVAFYVQRVRLNAADPQSAIGG